MNDKHFAKSNYGPPFAPATADTACCPAAISNGGFSYHDPRSTGSQLVPKRRCLAGFPSATPTSGSSMTMGVDVSRIELDHLLGLAAAAAAAAAPRASSAAHPSLTSGQQLPHPSLLGAIDRFPYCQQLQEPPARGSSLAYAPKSVAPRCAAASLPRLIHQQHKGRHYHQPQQQQQQQQDLPAVLKRIDRFLSLDTLGSEEDVISDSSSGGDKSSPSPPTSSTSSILFRLDCALERPISAGGEGGDSTSPLSADPAPHFLGQSASHFPGQAAVPPPLQLQYMAAAAAEPSGPHLSSCGMMPLTLPRQQQQQPLPQQQQQPLPQQQLLAWATDHYPMYVPAPLYVDHSSPAALKHTNELLAGACLPDGVRFMPVSASSHLYRLSNYWGFTAYAISLGSSYFQRLLHRLPGLLRALQDDPQSPLAPYLPFVSHSSMAPGAAACARNNAVSRMQEPQSVLFTCVYLAMKVCDRVPKGVMLRSMLAYLRGGIMPNLEQANEVADVCLRGLSWRLGPHFLLK